MLLQHPQNARNPFYEMAPSWALFPLIGLATLATVIASQALITAAFSVTKQAMQLGYLPRLRIRHTSVRETGQIYVPFVNWALFGCVVFAVVVFGTSSALASAYGIAVTIDMTITTVDDLLRHPLRLEAAAGALPAGDRLLLQSWTSPSSLPTR